MAYGQTLVSILLELQLRVSTHSDVYKRQVLTGYDAATGALQFDAQSGSVIDIPSYVLKLQKTGLFRKVDYLSLIHI